MNALYLDIFSGISGDMFLGAMLDLGVDFHLLERELAKLRLEGYHLSSTRKLQGGIEGVKFDLRFGGSHDHHGADHPHDGPVDTHHHDHGPARTLQTIRQLIEASSLSDWVRQRSVAVFQRIAAAEGKVHGVPGEQVHFHEVGAIDSIVDIVGSCLALEALGKPRVLAAPVVDGTGWVQCVHGRFPLPTPATLEILGARGIAVTQCDEPHELVTPTGAALLAEFAESFGPMRGLVPAKVGYGLGSRENQSRPNVLRAILGEVPAVSERPALDWEADTAVVLETDLDDVNSEILGHFVEIALAAGALDVFHTPIQMKKSRPAVLLTVLCTEADADRLSELILRETSAFGVRRYTTERRKLRREFTTVQTPYGPVAVKLGSLNGQVVQMAPEYESCRELAEKAGVPVKQIYEAVSKAANTIPKL
jgi:uncharacterized protein (TIGR00299 family) protein